MAGDESSARANLPPLDAVADTVGGRTAQKQIVKVKPGGFFASVLGALQDTAKHSSVKVVFAFSKHDRKTLDLTGNAPGYLQLANIWMILNVGGGPTPDKPTVTLSVPDPNHINSFMNFRVADIQACYELWKSRGAEFITEPIPKYGETRCYIRDPDGYIIEVGQSTDLTYG